MPAAPRWCARPGCGVELHGPDERCLPHQDPAAWRRINRLTTELLSKAQEA
jgi:hypothetical protein